MLKEEMRERKMAAMPRAGEARCGAWSDLEASETADADTFQGRAGDRMLRSVRSRTGARFLEARRATVMRECCAICAESCAQIPLALVF